MSLYRLDYVGARPVRDWRGDILTRTYSDACQRAARAASEAAHAVLVTRIGSSGILTQLVTVGPDGRRSRVTR